MSDLATSRPGNATDDATTSDDSEAALFFFFGLIVVWTSIIILSFCAARCGCLQSTQESEQDCQAIDDQIITKRAVSFAFTSEDVEAGCEAIKDTPECSICINSFQEHDIVSWSQNQACRHVFHHTCIIPWLTKDPQCPCCRQPFLGISSNRAATTFFSVHMGLVDTCKATPEQKDAYQKLLESSELIRYKPNTRLGKFAEKNGE